MHYTFTQPAQKFQDFSEKSPAITVVKIYRNVNENQSFWNARVINFFDQILLCDLILNSVSFSVLFQAMAEAIAAIFEADGHDFLELSVAYLADHRFYWAN